jgi:hypothetical protein
MPIPRILVAAILVLPACVDRADPVETTCAPSPAAATADPIAVRGRVVEEIGAAPVASAIVELRDAVTGVRLAETATDATGAYATTVATGGAVVVRAISADGFLPGYGYDPVPATDAPSAQMLVTRGELDALYSDAGIAPDPTKSTLLVVVTDCADHMVRGATVSVPGAARVVYLGDDTHFDPRATATSGNSAALVLGVPPGDTDVAIEAGDLAYRPWPVIAYADAFVTSWRKP